MVFAVLSPGPAPAEAQSNGGRVVDYLTGLVGDATGLELIVDGDVAFSLSGLDPTLTLEQVKIGNVAWASSPHLAAIERLSVTVDSGALLRGDVDIVSVVASGFDVFLEMDANGNGNWRSAGVPAGAVDASDGTADGDADVDADTGSGSGVDLSVLAVDTLLIEDGELSIRRRLTPVGEVGDVVVTDRFRVRLDTLRFDTDERETGDQGDSFTLAVEGSIQNRALDIAASGNGLQALLLNDGRLNLGSAEMTLGDSHLSAAATVELGNGVGLPVLTAAIESNLLASAQLQEIAAALTPLFSPPGADPDPVPATGPADFAPLRRLAGDLTLDLHAIRFGAIGIGDGDGPAGDAGRSLPDAKLQLGVKLHDGVLSIDRLDAAVAGQRLIGDGRIDASSDAARGQLRLRFPTFDIAALAQRFGPAGALPAGTLQGALQLDIVPPEAAGGLRHDDAVVPGYPVIGDSLLVYRGPAGDTDIEMKIAGALTGREDAGAAVGVATGRGETGGLRIAAQGRWRGATFALDFAGDPLATLWRPVPYRLRTTLTAAESLLRVSGSVAEPWRLGGLDLTVAARGPDPQRLSPLLGIDLPQLPPYDVTARVRPGAQGLVGGLTLQGIDGRIGDSDIAGDLALDWRATPLRLQADLRSRRLDLDDLGALIGVAPDPNETASPGQRREAQREAASPLLLPDEPLGLQRLAEAINGTVRYRAAAVSSPKLAIDDLSLTLNVRGRQVDFEPLSFGLGGGTVAARLGFDTRGGVPRGQAAVEVRRVDLRRVLAPFELADDSVGTIGGQMKFWFEGDTVARLAASADGGVILLMTDGRLDALLAEVAGLDLLEAAALLFVEPDASTPIDCAYVDMLARDGIFDVTTLLFDTADTLFLGDGFVDLNQELMSIALEPKPKDVSLLSTRSTVYLKGRLKEPSVFPGNMLYARLAASAALAAITPAAALLPLIEPATGEDSVYCSGLVDRINRERVEDQRRDPLTGG